MEAKSQFTRPILVDRTDGTVSPLEPVTLEAAGPDAYTSAGSKIYCILTVV